MNLNGFNSQKFYYTIKIIFLTFYCTHSISAQKLTPKIVGGYNVSSIEGFKHQVSLRDASHERSVFGSGHICGGSLIDFDTVLTAAHCVHDGDRYLSPAYYVAVMGNLDLFIQNTNTVVRRVIKIIGHRKYDPDTFVNDIALLKLNAPVPKDHPTAQPIRLSKTEARPGIECHSSGWGSIQYEENARAVRWLMAVNLAINSRADCNRRDSHAGSVIRGQFCAGPFTGGKDTCQGDSGGPFTCNGVLVGVTSHGYECGLPNYPGIYMDVGYYRDWIGAANSAILKLSNLVVISAILLLLSLL